jgi:hypothetical protein
MDNDKEQFVVESKDFAERFNKAVENMIARKMKISLPTLRRWQRGVTSPHPLMQNAIFKALEGDE